jgi:hypothetical protein
MLRSGLQTVLFIPALAFALALTPGTARPDEIPAPSHEPVEAEDDDDGQFSVSFVVPFDRDFDDDGDTKRFKLLDLWIVKFVDMESRKDPEYYKLDVVDVPLITLFSRERDDGHNTTGVLTLPGFALYKNESRRDTHVDRQVLKLPLIGSLFRYRRTPTETRTDLLFLMHWTTPVSSGAPDDLDPPR